MLTKANFREVCSPVEFKKRHVVLMDGVPFIVMAQLQTDSENPITYNVCRLSDFLGSRFGVKLAVATLIVPESLTSEERQRANSFT